MRKIFWPKTYHDLKGHSGRNFFASFFLKNFFIHLKINFIKFELSTTIRSQYMTIWISLKTAFFPLEILTGFANTNKILHVCNGQKVFSAVLLSSKAKDHQN